MRRSNWIYSVIILTVISFLTIGYSAFTNQLYVDGFFAHFRAEADIRVTNVSIGYLESDALTQYDDYGVNTLLSDIVLPNSDSSVTYNVDVTNFGGVEMVISKLNGLPDNLEYSFDNYALNHVICDNNNNCKLGVTKTLLLTIKYKDGMYDSNNVTYNLNLEFVFEEFSYFVNYILKESSMQLTEELHGSDDSITLNDGVYTVSKNEKYTGLYISSDYLEDGKTYILSYKLRKISGTLVNIGGHSENAIEKKFLIDGISSSSSYHQPKNNLINDTNEHIVEFKFKYDASIVSSVTPNSNIYIQVNRTGNTATPVVANIYDIHLFEVYEEANYGYNEKIVFPSGPSSDDYIVSGWNTRIDGSGINYSVGQEGYNLSYVNGSFINLFAKLKTYAGQKFSDVIKENAVSDNGPSEFVKNETGIDFQEPSSEENGRGIYIVADTLNNENPIYYYRGAVDNNNVLFAGFCWKMLRTTDTGGLKLLYNGVPVNGSCDNTGWDSQIASGVYFNPTARGIAGAGYSYTTTSDLVMKTVKDANILEGTIFAHNIDYNEETGKYTLIGDKIMTTANYATEKYDQVKEHHYTCFKTVDEECDSVNYVYMARDNNNYYAVLKNGMDGIEDILHIDFEGGSANGTVSTLQAKINTWYNGNMTGYTDYLEDTIYCNDRSIYNPWNLTSSIANDDNSKLNFGAKGRVAFTGEVTIECKYKADSFTVSSEIGNGALVNPVGTVSYDEAAFAGVAWWKSSADSFLNNGKVWWTMSPGFISTTGVYNGIISSQLDHVAVNWVGSKTTINSINYYQGGGVRPVISLKPNTVIKNGFGTVDKPFKIE